MTREFPVQISSEECLQKSAELIARLWKYCDPSPVEVRAALAEPTAMRFANLVAGSVIPPADLPTSAGPDSPGDADRLRILSAGITGDFTVWSVPHSWVLPLVRGVYDDLPELRARRVRAFVRRHGSALDHADALVVMG